MGLYGFSRFVFAAVTQAHLFFFEGRRASGTFVFSFLPSCFFCFSWHLFLFVLLLLPLCVSSGESRFLF